MPLEDEFAPIAGLVSLEPDGPPAAWAAATAARLDTTLEGALPQAAAYLPDVAATLVGREAAGLAAAISAVGEWLDGGDGLVPLAATQPQTAAWRRGTIPIAAHHKLPSSSAIITQVRAEITLRTTGLAAGQWAVLLLAPSFLGDRPWDTLLTPVPVAQRANVDLDVPNLRPELVDLVALAVATHYAVRLRDDGLADLTAQIAHVVNRVRELQPNAKVLLVGASTAGTAAVQYAAANQAVTLGLVTLGSPLAAAPVAPLEDPALADAVRAVRRLAPALGRPTLDAALGFLHDAVDGLANVRAASFATVRALPDFGTVPALALTGRLELALGTSVRNALVAGLNTATRRPPTHAAAAIELPLPLAGRASPIRVDLDALVDLGRISLTTGTPAAPKRVRVRARIVNHRGALLEGHLTRTDTDIDARVRWAELELELTPGSVAFAVRMHDAVLHGARSAVSDLSDALGPQLLALLVDELDQLAELTPRLRSLLDLLKDLDILVFDSERGLAPAADAFAQLEQDATRWLAPRLAALLDSADGFARLVRAADAADGRGPWTRSLEPLPLELRVTPEPWTVTLATTEDGFVLWPDVASVAATLTLPLAGTPQIGAELDLGPLRVRRDGATGTITLAVEDLVEPLAIAPPAADLQQRLLAAVPALLVSGALSAVLDGLLGHDGSSQVRNLHRLLHDPGAFLHERLFAPDTAGQLNAALAALGSLVGLTVTADGALALPAGLTLRAGAADGVLSLDLATPAGGLAIVDGAALDLRFGVRLDEARGATPAGHVGLIVDLPDSGPNSWDSVTLMTALGADGVRVTVQPAGSEPLELVPHFAGWSAIVDDAVARLLPQALDALMGQLPTSTLKTDAIGVAQALGVYGTSFATGTLPLRQLTLETVAQRAGALAPKVSALLGHAVGANLPGTIVPTGTNGVAITIPNLLGGQLVLTAGFADETVELALTDIALGPVAADLDLRWAGEFSGSIALDVDLAAAVGFDLAPRLQATLAPGTPFGLIVLPLGAGSAAAASIELAPAPKVTLTAQGRSRIAQEWLAPLGVSLLVDAARTQLETPLWEDGKSAAQLLRAAGVLTPARRPEVTASRNRWRCSSGWWRRSPGRSSCRSGSTTSCSRSTPARPRTASACGSRATWRSPSATSRAGCCSATGSRSRSSSAPGPPGACIRGCGSRAPARGSRARAGARCWTPTSSASTRSRRASRPSSTCSRRRAASARRRGAPSSTSKASACRSSKAAAPTTRSRSRCSTTPARARATPSTRAWTSSSASTPRASRSRSPAPRPASPPGSRSSAASGRSTSTRSGSRAARRRSEASCSTTSACSSTGRSRWPGCRSAPKGSGSTCRRSTSASRRAGASSSTASRSPTTRRC